MARPTKYRGRKVTAQKAAEFLNELARCGNVSQAADLVGIKRCTLYKERKANDEFAQLWDEASEIGVAALEDEARRRAFDGWDEPVWHKGEMCGAVRKFSDTLLIFLLKAHKPEKYRDNMAIEHSGGITVICGTIDDPDAEAGS